MENGLAHCDLEVKRNLWRTGEVITNCETDDLWLAMAKCVQSSIEQVTEALNQADHVQ